MSRGDDRDVQKRAPRVSDKWVQWAVDAMAEKKWTQEDLARAVGCDAVYVHRLIKKKMWTRYCTKIAEKLGIAEPYVLVSSQEEADWIEAGRVLAEHDPKRFASWLAEAKKLAGALEKRADADREVDSVLPPGSSDPRATS